MTRGRLLTEAKQVCCLVMRPAQDGNGHLMTIVRVEGGDDHGDGAVDHGADGDRLGVVEDQLYASLLRCALQSAFVIVALLWIELSFTATLFSNVLFLCGLPYNICMLYMRKPFIN